MFNGTFEQQRRFEVLHAERAKLIDDMKSLNNKILKEKRAYTPDENARYEHFENRLDEIEAGEYAELRKLNDDRGGNRAGMDDVEVRDFPNATQQGVRKMQYAASTSGYRYDETGTSPRDIYNKFLRHGVNALSPTEYRALQADSSVGGGFLGALRRGRRTHPGA